MPKTKTQPWWKTIDSDEISEAMSVATTDAYDDHEQHTGLLTAIDEDVRFPFKAVVLGQNVEIMGSDIPPDDGLGLDLICEFNGQRHRIAARNIELIKPFPQGYAFLAAYLDWKSRF